jgi:hypothetical protein
VQPSRQSTFNLTFTAFTNVTRVSSVLLDYADATKGNITLQMVRIPATQLPSKGGIFINPGGPGGAGTSFFGELSADLVAKFGADWDLVSWDPRESSCLL